MRKLLLVLLLAAAAPGQAQQSPALPPWAVPVLRLVSETHVQPTTGIVLPGGERVLVSADFGAPGDEIVVLDGGTDIVRHGRPARPVQVFAELGLKVLAVPGLQRAGAPLAPAMPTGRASIRLAAFPPAEQIAEGQPPVDWRGALQPVPGGGASLSGPERPNVTGPLLDACDNLVGISLAAGLPTLSPSAGTGYHWRDELAALWAELGLPVTGRACAANEPAQEPPPEPAPEKAQPPAAPAADEEEPNEAPAAEEAGQPESDTGTAEEPEQEAAELPEALPPAEDAMPAEEPSRTLTWLAAIAVLLIAAGLAVRAWRRRPRTAGPASPAIGSASGAEARPAATVHLDVQPERPPASDGSLRLAGHYADGSPLEMRVPVDTRAIDLVIGRGGADVALDSPAVSRRHARLEGRAGALTLADLGSSNGTSVDGVPCFEGEVFFVEPGATVVLGDVRFRLDLLAGEAGEAP